MLSYLSCHFRFSNRIEICGELLHFGSINSFEDRKKRRSDFMFRPRKDALRYAFRIQRVKFQWIGINVVATIDECLLWIGRKIFKTKDETLLRWEDV